MISSKAVVEAVVDRDKTILSKKEKKLLDKASINKYNSCGKFTFLHFGTLAPGFVTRTPCI